MNLTRSDIVDVLEILTANAPDKTPKPTEDTITSWLKAFQPYPDVTGDDAVAAAEIYCWTLRDHLAQPQEIAIIANQLTERRVTTEAVRRGDLQAFGDIAYAATCDAKAGDLGALRWLLSKPGDYYGKRIIWWCTRQNIDWMPEASGGELRTGATDWAQVPRLEMPDQMIKSQFRRTVDEELAAMLTEDELFLVGLEARGESHMGGPGRPATQTLPMVEEPPAGYGDGKGEHPPGEQCAEPSCDQPSTFGRYCAKHFCLSFQMVRDVL